MELTILIWVVVGAGITAGVFLLARAIVELTAVGYRAAEHTISGAEAGRRSVALVAGAVVALVATALIAALTLLAIFGALLSTMR